ncbi:ABC transporter substrate-binding protein [Sneathiella marina]|uniref:ABC transporter substrate-binding protein n=1 Tax=Sneathiella marina TaxID=2950108 RepID=A0ABY4W7D6_9PROT|nr:ABC transporter substrate-binding protein [Sneathiella marina]USG62958.1 ABC transporter substrate-binding protein [Sneathiella marina]
MLKKRTFLISLLSAAVMCTFSFLPISAAENSNAQAATALIKSMGDDAIKTLSNKSLSESQKEHQFEKYLDESFNMKLIGRFVLGNNWRTATDEQRKEFLSVFRDYMVVSYGQKIGSYSGESLKIKDAKPINDKESLVYSVIEQPNGPPIKLDWRVRKANDGKQQIVDVIVEGVSLAVTQRSEFSAVVNKPGVGVDGLIKKLQEQVKAEGS